MLTPDDKRRGWTRSELILAFNLYCQIPFGRIHNRNPQIIELAARIRRSASAVSWKLANLARLDPTLAKRDIKGASHGSKQDELIWKEFEGNWEALAFESEMLRFETFGHLSEVSSLGKEVIAQDFPEGRTREALVRVRINQNFFRRAVLSAYGGKCCITGIDIPELLNASHIIPWSVDIPNRTNPQNGLCLNVFHDRAFDNGLITLSDDFTIRLSPKITAKEGTARKSMLLDYNGAVIQMPEHFLPSQVFLRYHREHIFQHKV